MSWLKQLDFKTTYLSWRAPTLFSPIRLISTDAFLVTHANARKFQSRIHSFIHSLFAIYKKFYKKFWNNEIKEKVNARRPERNHEAYNESGLLNLG